MIFDFGFSIFDFADGPGVAAGEPGASSGSGVE
jgi:hypothetical protein